MARKATRLELLEREQDIQRLMSQGVDRNQICEQIGRKYAISPRTVETQYYRIVDEMARMVEEGRDELRVSLMARQEMIFKQAAADGQLKTALDAINSQAKLGGLYDAKALDNKQPKVIVIGEGDFSQKSKASDDE